MWLNGPFGGGKTSTAEALRKARPQWRVFDPEAVGYFLRAALPDLADVADFQDWPAWRPLVAASLHEVSIQTGQHLIAPQSVLTEAYYTEIAGRLEQAGHRVVHVVLDAPVDVLRERIEAVEEGRAWRLAHLPAYLEARRWMTARADIVLDTSALDARAIARAILADLDDRTSSDTGPLSAVGPDIMAPARSPLAGGHVAGGPAVVRPTSRVLLVDDLDRALLFASVSEDDGATFWYPPGGGVESGEDYEQAGIREVFEETGLALRSLPSPFAIRQDTRTMAGIAYEFVEHWHLVRVPAFEIDTTGFNAAERATIQRHHWWTVGEMLTTTDRLTPLALADILSTLLSDGAPDQPWKLSR